MVRLPTEDPVIITNDIKSEYESFIREQIHIDRVK